MPTKTCTKCNCEKDIAAFVIGRNVCKECLKEQRRIQSKRHYQKYKKDICKKAKVKYEENKEYYKTKAAEYRIKNKEKIQEINRKYKENNEEKIKDKNKKYYLKNKEKLKTKTKEYTKNNPEIKRNWYRKKRKSDIAFKIKHNITNLILKHLKLKNIPKDNSIQNILNYTVSDLKLHLEKQFETWMNWDNHGKTANSPKTTWHIDHIKPINTFNITSIYCEDFKKCWALENLRPLDSYINVRRPKNGKDININNKK